MPCTAISPNDERFQPPKLWNAIGTGIGTLTPTMPIWMRLANSRAGAAVAGEARLGLRVGAGTELQRQDALARSRVWIRGDEPRIEVGRLDDPYRDDARVSAVRGYERATDLELLTKRIARLVGHRIVLRMVQQRAFEFSPIARRETDGHEEFCFRCPGRMNGTQQILGDLPIVQDRVRDPWQLAHSG